MTEVAEGPAARNALIVFARVPEPGAVKTRLTGLLTDGDKIANVPKDKKPEDLTLEECTKMIAEAPARKKKGRGAAKKTATKKPAAKKTSTKKAAKKATAKKAAKKK